MRHWPDDWPPDQGHAGLLVVGSRRNGLTYTQGWTVDNRPVGLVKSVVTGMILATTTISYDGDGVRVKKSDPSGTTYYAFGGAMVAMRTAATATLTYLHGDHPSTSLRAGCYKPGACLFALLRASSEQGEEARCVGQAAQACRLTSRSHRSGLVVTVPFLCPPGSICRRWAAS